jgi:hypothetical protein
MFAFLKRAKGNDSKLEKCLLKKRSHEESLDAQTEAAVQKELKKAEAEIRCYCFAFHVVLYFTL